MKDIKFKKDNGEIEVFFSDYKGQNFSFPYFAPIDILWEGFKVNDFSVELLINSSLNLEANDYLLRSDIKQTGNPETIGAIFPVALLDTENVDLIDQRWANYVYAAYIILLERLPSFDSRNFRKLSECFEDNVCVCVVNRRTVSDYHPLQFIIHSLRRYGYCYFVEKNQYQEIESFNYQQLVAKQKNITVHYSEPALCKHPMVDMILRHLPYAHNVTYRFVVLYQIIEYIMEKYRQVTINEAINDFQLKKSTQNDFINEINQTNSEKAIIKQIFDKANITNEIFNPFRNSCMQLFALIGYENNKLQDDSVLFYSFRNQMTHSYRKIQNYQEELACTIQSFENVVYSIVERHPDI